MQKYKVKLEFELESETEDIETIEKFVENDVDLKYVYGEFVRNIKVTVEELIDFEIIEEIQARILECNLCSTDKIRAIVALEEIKTNLDYRKKIGYNSDEDLKFLFKWSDTREGIDFWNKVDNSLFKC